MKKDTFKKTLASPGCFKVDNPFIRQAAATPEGMAQIIILVLSTIQVPFEKIAVVYSRLISILNTLYQHKDVEKITPKEGKPVFNVQEDLNDLITHETNALNMSKRFEVGQALFGWKWKGIAEVWNSRRELKAKLDNLATGLTGDIDNDEKIYDKMIEVLSKNVTGIQIAKSAFVVQLIYGRKACLDINNIDIWTAIAKAASFHELERQLDPIAYSKKKTRGEPLFADEEPHGAPTKWGWEARKPFGERIGLYNDILKGMYKLAGLDSKDPEAGPAMAWDTWSDFLGNLSQTRGSSIYKTPGIAAAQAIYDQLPNTLVPKIQGGKKFGLPVAGHPAGQAVSHQHLYAGLPFSTDTEKALTQSRQLAKHIVTPSKLGQGPETQGSLLGHSPKELINMPTEPDLFYNWMGKRIKKRHKKGVAPKIQFKDWFLAQESSLIPPQNPIK